MAISIEEHFKIAAPIEQVWDYFSKPPQIVPCLPGAQLVEVVDEKTYRGRVLVQVGPIKANYEGAVIIESLQPEHRLLSLLAQGDQSNTPGRAEARVNFSMQESGEGETDVVVQVTLSVTGRLAQMGGGMIQTVAKQLFRKFAECVQQELVTKN